MNCSVVKERENKANLKRQHSHRVYYYLGKKQRIQPQILSYYLPVIDIPSVASACFVRQVGIMNILQTPSQALQQVYVKEGENIDFTSRIRFLRHIF